MSPILPNQSELTRALTMIIALNLPTMLKKLRSHLENQKPYDDLQSTIPPLWTSSSRSPSLLLYRGYSKHVRPEADHDEEPLRCERSVFAHAMSVSLVVHLLSDSRSRAAARLGRDSSVQISTGSSTARKTPDIHSRADLSHVTRVMRRR